MKNSRIVSSGGYMVNLLLIMVMLVGCTLSDDENVLKSDSINDTDNVSADFRSIEDNPQLMDEFRNNLEQSLSNKSTFQESEILMKSNKKWIAQVHASGNLNEGGPFITAGSLYEGFYISLHAKKSDDGEVFGYIRFSDKNGKDKGSIEVSCLDVRGKYAFIGFFVDSQEYHMGFEDNGEGAKSNPDRFTQYYKPSGPVSCDVFANYVLNTIGPIPQSYLSFFKFEWTKGNIQVN